MTSLIPTVGTDPWDVAFKTLWNVAHNDDGTSKTAGVWPSSALQVFVDYQNGSDSNTGFSPAAAFKTIAAAYAALKTEANAVYAAGSNGMGVGTIRLLPGRHDVGTGVVIDYNRPCLIVGTRSGWGSSIKTEGQTIICSSSSTATEFITAGSSSHVTYGNRFREIAFEVDTAVNTSLTACIRAQAHDYLEVANCAAWVADGTTYPSAVLVAADAGGSAQDNAWHRITENHVTHVALYHAGSGTNFNRSVIEKNVCFYSGSLPMVFLEGDFSYGTVIANNLEGTTTAVKLTSVNCDHNVFINNAGEDHSTSGPPNPFYDFAGSTGAQQGNIIIGGYCLANGSAGLNGTWARFSANAFNNILIGAWSYAGTSGYKAKIVDNSTSAHGQQLISWQDGVVAWDKIFQAKGDLAAGTASRASAKVPVGVDGTFLKADSSQATGMTWDAVPTSLVTVVTRTSDSSPVSSSTTLADDDTLLFPMSGNGTDIWFVEAYLLVSAANAAMDIKFGWNVPGFTTCSWGGLGAPDLATDWGAVGTGTTLANGLSNQSGSTAFGTFNGGTTGIVLTGTFFDGGSSGNTVLRWAQNTSDAGNLVLKKGSFLRVTKVH